MKSILISQVKNGWLVHANWRNFDAGICRTEEDMHVFQTIPQLQEALPGLLHDKPTDKTIREPHITSEQCLESHKKAVEEFEAKAKEHKLTVGILRDPST